MILPFCSELYLGSMNNYGFDESRIFLEQSFDFNVLTLPDENQFCPLGASPASPVCDRIRLVSGVVKCRGFIKDMSEALKWVLLGGTAQGSWGHWKHVVEQNSYVMRSSIRNFCLIQHKNILGHYFRHYSRTLSCILLSSFDLDSVKNSLEPVDS